MMTNMTPTKPLNVANTLMYNDYWTCGLPCDNIDGYAEASVVVRAIIYEFVNQKKIIGSFTIAREIIRKSFMANVVITDQDIQDAYDIGAGGGCEFEWPFE